MVSETTVQTARATKYMKTLCGHFRLKVEASFDDERGEVRFSYGRAEMQAQSDSLTIRLEADTPDAMATLKEVVGGHLERFAAHADDSLQVTWVDAQSSAAS